MLFRSYMNPYRITYDKFLNPASSNSTARINKAVEELKNYDLDGIHFDDYFYHSKKWYVTPSDGSKYSLKVTGSSTTKKPSAKKKRKYVNAMLRSVKTNVKEKSGAIFGVSPAGNYENCMSSGADVKTWLGEEGATYYAHIPDERYLRGRATIISKLLSRETLFSSPLGARWERSSRSKSVV